MKLLVFMLQIIYLIKDKQHFALRLNEDFDLVTMMIIYRLMILCNKLKFLVNRIISQINKGYHTDLV